MQVEVATTCTGPWFDQCPRLRCCRVRVCPAAREQFPVLPWNRGMFHPREGTEGAAVSTHSFRGLWQAEHRTLGLSLPALSPVPCALCCHQLLLHTGDPWHHAVSWCPTEGTELTIS